MNRAMLRQLLWICITSAVKVGARKYVLPEEKTGPFVNPSYELCEQIQCLRVEDIFNATVNLYNNPCDDYYEYACHKNYTGSKDHRPFSIDADQVFNELKAILEEDMVRRLDQGNDALAIEKKIFKMCKEGSVFSNEEKRFYTQTILPRFGAHRLLADYDYTPHQVKHWDEADLSYALKGFGFAFFDVEVHEHILNGGAYDRVQPGRYILIKPPSYDVMQLSKLLNKYFNNKRSGDYSYGYNKYNKLDHFISTIFTAVTTAHGHMGEKTSDIIFKTIAEWHQIYGGHIYDGNAKIDWLNYLSKLFGTVRVSVSVNTVIAIQNQQYFMDLANILQRTSENDAIVDYVHLHFVSKSIGLADADYREYSILPQFKQLACTPGLLVGTAYRYADEYFPEENRQLLVNLISKVRDAVIARVNGLNVPIGKRQLLSDFVDEYVNADIYAGYPDWLMNGTMAYSIYGDSNTGHSSQFYNHQAHLIEHLQKTKLLPYMTPSLPIFNPSELRKGFESNEIQISKSKNDGSSEKTKEIVIPFGYFNEMDYRFFSSQLFDPINYGAAATEVAFKLYSDLLRRIDYYRIAPRCIRDQVPSNVRDGVEKEALVSKGVAYLLALEAAHVSWPSKNSYPIQFVDFGAITDSDLFFLSFAKSLCSIPPKYDQNHLIRRELETHRYRIDDPSALQRYMNFALQNFKPFSENYMCEKNHRMYRERQCNPFEFHSL